MTAGPASGLRVALLTTLPVAVIGGAVGATLQGPEAVWGVALGTALLVGFFVLGQGTVHLAAALAPALSLLVALMTYTLQVVLLGLAFVVLQQSGLLDDAVDRRWFAATIVVGTLLWTAALVRAATRERIPLYHTSATPATTREVGFPDDPTAG